MRRLGLLLAVLLASMVSSAQRNRVIPNGGYRIAGIVYDATSGQTLPGARISLGSAGGDSTPDRSAITGPDGSFAFDHLPADKYQMYGEAVGYPLQGFEQHESPYFTGVVVGPDISADHLVFRLQRGSSISGVVTDEFNEPVRDAQVMLFRRGLDNGEFSTHIVSNEQTDDQGAYKFGSLLPGTYFVAVSARPWYAHSSADVTRVAESMSSPQAIDTMKKLDVAFPLTFYSGATEAADASPITVRNGERASADIGLHSVPAVTIRMPSPGPRNGAMPFVRLSQQAFDNYEVPSSFQQRFEDNQMMITGVAPGRYIAHISIPGASAERVQDVDISGDTVIDPETFGSAGVCNIKGIAEMSGGAPVPPRLFIVARNQNRGTTQGSLVHDGQFSLDALQPGTYEISVVNAPEIYLLQMAARNAKVSGRSLTLTCSSSPELAVILGKQLADVRGVALRDGKGLGGTMVLLIPANPTANHVLFRRDQSDSDGTFWLQRVVPGRYSVVSIDGGWDLEWSRPDVLKPYLAHAEQIDVAAGGKYNVKVQVQPK